MKKKDVIVIVRNARNVNVMKKIAKKRNVTNVEPNLCPVFQTV